MPKSPAPARCPECGKPVRPTPYGQRCMSHRAPHHYVFVPIEDAGITDLAAYAKARYGMDPPRHGTPVPRTIDGEPGPYRLD